MTILVLPKNEEMMMHLRHPVKEVRAFVDMKTAIEWPFDQFTIRRLADGDVRKVGDVPNINQMKKRSGPTRFRAR
jgi:hypothetical protein